MKRPNKYDFDFSEDYESNLETYCDELEAIVSKGDCITHYEKKIETLEKALDKACELLESATEDGLILCPCEYLDICHCESTESGYECNGDVDYKWKDALIKDE